MGTPTDSKAMVFSSSGTSTNFGVSPPRSTLSEDAITSTPEAVQVGVDIAGREVHGLAGLQRDPVQQQGDQHAGIAGVLAVEAQHRGQFRLVAAPWARRRPARRPPVSVASLTSSPPAISRSNADLSAAASSGCDRSSMTSCRTAAGRRARELKAAGQVQEDCRGTSAGCTEPAQRLERGQREDHFRLVVVILVIAVRRVGRDAGGVLAGEPALACSRLGCTCSDSGFAAARILARNGSRGPNSATDAAPRKWSGSSVMSASSGVVRAVRPDGHRRRVRMGTDPQLGFRTAGLRPAKQAGDRRRRSPGIRPQDIVDFVHGLVSFSL